MFKVLPVRNGGNIVHRRKERKPKSVTQERLGRVERKKKTLNVRLWSRLWGRAQRKEAYNETKLSHRWRGERAGQIRDSS